MLSKIIKNIALILEDNQTLDNLLEVENNPNATLSNSTQTYISLINFVLANIAENFLCYNCTQDLVSDNEAKLCLSDLRYTPCTIRSVKDDTFKNAKFNLTIDHLYVGKPNRVYFVNYAYVPADLTSLTDTVLLPVGLDYKALCYGVVSEFYALKLQFTEANIWEQKFKQCLKNLNRTYREVRLASRRWL